MAVAKEMVVEHCPTCQKPWRYLPIMSRLKALKEPGLMRLTDWVQPGEKIVRTFVWPWKHDDPIFGQDWLKAEARRVLRSPRRRAVLAVDMNTGEQALFVDRVAGATHDDEDDE